jgi:hypothetical protein
MYLRMIDRDVVECVIEIIENLVFVRSIEYRAKM